MDLLERFDSHAVLRKKISLMADKVAEYAGVPMPLDGEELVIEPSYKFAQVLSQKSPPSKERVVNSWFAAKYRCELFIYEDEGGKRKYGLAPAVHHLSHDMRTLGCSDAWGIEQEAKAVNLLAKFARHRQFKQYMLTGMFLESSARSGVMYMFRRLKPTVAMSMVGDGKILCCLCMHPIAYYADSWAGAMCPTDDVIAHLMMMRADEPMFWKRCNQIPAWRPEAGL